MNYEKEELDILGYALICVLDGSYISFRDAGRRIFSPLDGAVNGLNTTLGSDYRPLVAL